MSLPLLLAALALGTGAALACADRTRGLAAHPRWLLLPLAGLAALTLALGQAPFWSQRAQLALLALTCPWAPLAAAALGRSTPSSLGLPAALLLSASGALAAAFSIPAALHVGRPPALPASLVLAQLSTGGLALGLILLALAQSMGRVDATAAPRHRAAAAAVCGLLLLAALPSLGGYTVGGGFGLLPATGDTPQLARVLSSTALVSGDGALGDLHLLPLRLPVPGMCAPLATAAFLLALALLLALLDRPSGPHRSEPSRPLRAALASSGGLLLLTGLLVALAEPLLPGAELPGSQAVLAWVEDHLLASSARGSRLTLLPWPPRGAGFTPLGAGLDLGMLLLSGGLCLGVGLGRPGREGGETRGSTASADQEVPLPRIHHRFLQPVELQEDSVDSLAVRCAPDARRQGASDAVVLVGTSRSERRRRQRRWSTDGESGLLSTASILAMVALALSLLVGSLATDRLLLSAWARDSRLLGTALSCGLVALAAFCDRERRLTLAAGLLLLAFGTLLATLVAAGRGPLGTTLIDGIAVF